MAKKLTRAERIAKIPIEEIGKLKGASGRKQLETYLKNLEMGYKRRVQSFRKRGITSYAQLSFESGIPAGVKSRQSIKDMTRNQLILEIARYQKFFNDKTSSIEGIKEVNREQDIRIFGKNRRGQPRKRMTEDERKRFWSLYEEYLNQDPTASSKYGSESIQQMVADALFSGEEKTITELLDGVETRLKRKTHEENLRSVPNVYSGRGPAVKS